MKTVVNGRIRVLVMLTLMSGTTVLIALSTSDEERMWTFDGDLLKSSIVEHQP